MIWRSVLNRWLSAGQSESRGAVGAAAKGERALARAARLRVSDHLRANCGSRRRRGRVCERRSVWICSRSRLLLAMLFRFTYERTAIEEWFAVRGTSPMTNLVSVACRLSLTGVSARVCAHASESQSAHHFVRISPCERCWRTTAESMLGTYKLGIIIF